jgi:hypothetical protein
MVYAPLTVVPQVGQFGVVPQPLMITNNAVIRMLSRILGLIKFPPAISLQDQLLPALPTTKPVDRSIPK